MGCLVSFFPLLSQSAWDALSNIYCVFYFYRLDFSLLGIDVMDLRKLKWFICVVFVYNCCRIHCGMYCNLHDWWWWWWYFRTLIINWRKDCDRFEIMSKYPRAGKLYLMLCPRKFCMRMMKDANCQRISLLKPLYTHLIGGDVDSIANQAKENPLA